MASHEGALLLWKFLFVSVVTCTIGVTVFFFASDAPTFSVDSALSVMVYLNITTLQLSGGVTSTFLALLRGDLHDDIFSDNFTEGDVSFLGTPFSDLPVCSRSCSQQPGGAAAKVPRNCSAVLLCEWRVGNLSLMPVNLHQKCRERVRALAVFDGAEHNEANSSAGKYRGTFRRLSGEYHTATGDPRGLVAVGGDCHVLKNTSFRADSVCGRVSCLNIIVILSSCVVLLFLVLVALCFFGDRLGCYSCPGEEVGNNSFGLRSQLVVSLLHDCGNSSSATCGVKPEAEELSGFSGPRSTFTLSCDVSQEDSVESNRANSLKMERHVTNVLRGNDQCERRSDSGQGTATFVALSRDHCSPTPQSGPSHVDGVYRPAHDGVQCSGLNTPHLSWGFSAVCEIEISREERERLQRQRSWLGEHVIGLDTLCNKQC